MLFVALHICYIVLFNDVFNHRSPTVSQRNLDFTLHVVVKQYGYYKQREKT